jgi:hypothetical protein
MHLTQQIMTAFNQIQKYGQASIADIQSTSKLTLPLVHSAIQELRRQGILSGSGVEVGDERIRSAAIREGGDLIGYVSLRR